MLSQHRLRVVSEEATKACTGQKLETSDTEILNFFQSSLQYSMVAK